MTEISLLQNRFLLSFLCALVELGVFREIVVYFLLVGHTGNAVDQKFSIITQELKKSEIKTLEDLINLISNSMTHKCNVESLTFTWDWKSFITQHLTSPQLQNHSFYNGFKVSREEEMTKLRFKRLPQDQEWLPPTGIQLINKNITFNPIGSSDFRVESLNLDKIFHDLEKYLRRMPAKTRVAVSQSWSRLREELEGLPKMKKNLPPMKLSELPKMLVEAEKSIPDHYEFVEEDRDNLPEILGKVFEQGLFDANIKPGLDVIVYTRSLVGRPWVGRVNEIHGNQTFSIQWFDRQGKTLKFRAMVNPDKTPYISVLDNSTVMFWDISVERSESSFQLSPYWLTKVMKEYKICDAKS